MRTSQVLFSAVHFFVVFLVLGVGALFLALPHAEGIWNKLYHLKDISHYIGWGILAFGGILLWASFAVNRRQYVQMDVQGTLIDIDAKVVRECAHSFFKDRFPGEDLFSDVAVQGRSSIEIFTSLPKPQEEEFFEEVEKDLCALLAEKLGYQRPFTLTFVETP